MAGVSLGIRINELCDLGEKDAHYCANMPTIHSVKDCNSKICKIEIKSDGTHIEKREDGTEKTLEKASINLHDCLGCKYIHLLDFIFFCLEYSSYFHIEERYLLVNLLYFLSLMTR